MNDQPKTDQDATLAALRERAAEISALLDAIERNKLVAEARLAEINTTIEIVVRAGKKKPGPKPGGHVQVDVHLKNAAAELGAADQGETL